MPLFVLSYCSCFVEPYDVIFFNKKCLLKILTKINGTTYHIVNNNNYEIKHFFFQKDWYYNLTTECCLSKRKMQCVTHYI